jgi:hypothetical protein
MNTRTHSIHTGPHAGVLALLYTVLYLIGLYPVTAMYAYPDVITI